MGPAVLCVAGISAGGPVIRGVALLGTWDGDTGRAWRNGKGDEGVFGGSGPRCSRLTLSDSGLPAYCATHGPELSGLFSTVIV